MKTFFNKLFTENVPWKIFSFTIATLLWVFVINTQNPTQPQEIAGIKVIITGYDTLSELGYELSNKNEILSQNFRLIVSGPRLEVDKLVRDPSLVTATLNLSDYIDDLTQDSLLDNAQYVIKINLDGSNIVIRDRRPEVAKVRIDKIANKEQRVTFELDQSITKQYTLLGDGLPVINPDKIKIMGTKSEIDRVAEAKVYIEAKDFSEEQLTTVLPIRLYDINGEEITELELSPAEAIVKLPIGSKKVVPININYTGELKKGYIITKVESSLDEVTLIGKTDVLEKIESIELEPISLTDITESQLLQVRMQLPDNVITLEGDRVSVSLQVSEENVLKLSSQIQDLNIQVEGLGEGLTYEIVTPSVDIVLSGIADKLIGINKSQITAKLSLAGRTPGEYQLPLVVTAPNDIKVQNSPIMIRARILRQEVTE